ncbi:MAG: pantetheine-phosphate adenylyltransferase [Verrucomicrobium sp.]|nr:pantetheine-phosphate adenylyltransferase [Verrucomicrobium sp.]
MSTPRKVIYPGSFDPITNGHLDVLARAQNLFDEVILAVSTNASKNPLFTIEERCQMAQEVAKDFPKPFRVATFDGLLVDFVKKEGACAILRGLRAISDFEFEFQLALMNRNLAPQIETVFLMPRESYTYLSSSMIRQVCSLNGPIGAFVPAHVERALVAKLASRSA